MNVYVVNQADKEFYRDALPKEPDIEDLIVIAAVDDEAEDEPLVGITSVSADAGSIYRIEYLYVVDEYRNRGVGSALVGSVRTLLKGIGAETLTASYFMDDENEYMGQCLRGAGFSKTGEKTINTAPLSSVRTQIDRFRKKASRFTGIMPLNRISDEQWEQFIEEYFLHLDKNTVLTGFGDRHYYDSEISMVAVGDDDQCRGFLLLSSIEDDVAIDYLWSSDETGVTSMALIAASVDAIKTDGSVFFDPANSAAAKLASKLLKDDITDNERVVSMVATL